MGQDEKGRLTPGGMCRIYRDGEVLSDACHVPSRGDFTIRGLDPGSYTARDEDGNAVEFAVSPLVETTLIQSGEGDVDGGEVGGASSAMPGSARVDEVPIRDVGPSAPDPGPQTYPEGDAFDGDVPGGAPEVDVPVPGEPGSAHVQPIEEGR